MLLLLSVIHVVFIVIFYFFHRYVEIGLISFIYMFFFSKTFSWADFFKKPAFLKSENSEKVTFEQSLYLSSGILFYTALIGLALGLATSFQVPIDFRLLDYCVLFLSSVIYILYFSFYPRNPHIFVLFRVHNIIAGLLCSLLVVFSLLFPYNSVTFWQIINGFLLTVGLLVVLVYDRYIRTPLHVLSVYVFVFSTLTFMSSLLSSLLTTLTSYVVSILFSLITLSFLVPSILKQVVREEHTPILRWHFFNFLVGLSWGIFFYLSWELFFGVDTFLIFGALLALIFWWLIFYKKDNKNPLFFSGALLVVGVLYIYFTFQVLPTLFWIISLSIFVFSGTLLVLSSFFQKNKEELILAAFSAIFLCVTDIILLFQDHSLLAFSIFFIIQSLLWYGAYEIFHRHTHGQNSVL